jgi:hypothetical protein
MVGLLQVLDHLQDRQKSIQVVETPNEILHLDPIPQTPITITIHTTEETREISGERGILEVIEIYEGMEIYEEIGIPGIEI